MASVWKNRMIKEAKREGRKRRKGKKWIGARKKWRRRRKSEGNRVHSAKEKGEKKKKFYWIKNGYRQCTRDINVREAEKVSRKVRKRKK